MLNPRVTAFGDLSGGNKVKLGQKGGGPNLIRLVSLKEGEETPESSLSLWVHTDKRSCEGTARKWPLANQISYQKPKLVTP